MVTANQHHQARLAIHSEQEAREAGYTRAVMFEAAEMSIFALVHPEADLDGDVLAWDNAEPSAGIIVVHGHMFDEVHDE